MKEQIKLNIIDTLSYFDVFSYPLTLKQIRMFLHYSNTSPKLIKECLSEISIINKKYNYYFFSGREEIAVKRKIREEENIKKLKLARRYSSLLSFVPGVQLVALTGSVAMENASRNDDIDLFIITRRNMLWITRFLVILLTKFLGKKREHKQKDFRDKLCLNMFLDERDLEFYDKNIYIAHEIVQMKVFFDRGSSLNALIQKNLWIKEYFPNTLIREKEYKNKRQLKYILFGEKILRILNFTAFFIQFLYMNNKITKEKVSLQKALFHPNDNSRIILNEYEKRRISYFHRYNLSLVKRNFESREAFSKKIETN